MFLPPHCSFNSNDDWNRVFGSNAGSSSIIYAQIRNPDVGRQQAINVVYHAPAPVSVIIIFPSLFLLSHIFRHRGTHLEIVSTTMAIGGRTMSARCEVWIRVVWEFRESSDELYLDMG
jgi:hypothetical protein